jgi:hypothetical protein
MTITTFILVSAVNIGILFFLLRKRGWLSAEGLCAIYLFLAVISDNVEILVRTVFWPDTLLLGPEEITMRIYPTIVHSLGVAALLVGLTVADPRPRPLSRALSPSDTRSLVRIAVALVVIGGLMFGIAVLRGVPTGFTTVEDVKDIVEQPGAFLYRGADVALVGLALLFATLAGPSKVLCGLAAVVLPVIALYNKGGFEKGLMWTVVAYSVYQSKLFKRILTSSLSWTVVLPTAALVILLVIGVKIHYRTGGDAVQSSDAFQAGLDSVRGRYSADGLYRGYSQMTTYMRNGWISPFDGRMLSYALTCWIPGFVYPDKPVHPTRDTGYMVYADHHSYKGDASAFTLVGVAYADYGIPSVVCYLLAGGFVLGWIRKAANRAGGNLYRHVGYLFLCLFGACSAESGLLLLLYVAMLCAGVMGLAWILVHIMFRERGRGSKAHSFRHTQWKRRAHIPMPRGLAG